MGTSGWHYDDWRGLVYPPHAHPRDWFDHYRRLFDCVEVNNSFYRLPTEQAIARWRDQAPPGFRYAMKGSRFTTHNLKIGGDRLPDSVERVMARFSPMRSVLGVVVWQLPPNLHRDCSRLARFCDLLPRWCRHAVEFRHPSWDDDAVQATLAAAGVARVWVSDARPPQPTPRTADFAYLRLHGLGEHAYRWNYSDAEMAPWVRRIAAVRADGQEAWIFFNNDYGGHAVRNAERFRELLQATT